ncbi:MAG: glycosyltransferase family 9 protein [Ignavibacteriales bacterium]|nr:glycosyltransferase family 9 protein [Ignavibacteriales bacterium]
MFSSLIHHFPISRNSKFKFGFRLTKLNKEKINKILIIKLRGIGDVVLSTIVLNNLRKDFPNARIDYLVEAPSEQGLLGLKDINRVLLFERNDFWKKVSLIFQIRKNKYDIIFDFFTNPSTALITFLSGAEYRVGFPYRGRRYAYNLYGPEERGKYHSAQLHLETLKLLGLNYSYKELHYFIILSALHVAEKYLNNNFIENNFVIGICPTGGWVSKKCDPEKFAEIADALIKKFNAKIFIIWGKSDEEDAFKIHSLLGEKSSIAPETTIQELAAMIARCKILISNDSGPMHIAAAVGTPVLGLFGPTNPYMHGPFGDKNEWIRLDELDCIECNLLVCPRKHECFRDLPVEKVLGKVELLISKNNIVIPSHG